ncbi:MAG TPA: thiamine pyrophosphate-dependent enzyme [Bacteroidia bacterium]|jgi:pyruvate oxidase|nr:thiamine pyrophosphate-dependent enzyme [Bacteroidia bacterium]
MNVCEALLNVLTDYGVKYIFGIPGDSINELIEAIRKQDKIKFIHVMHEEAGAFAASAQAKLTGELAVCVGTSGPGAIHLLNGLYDAKLDHAPVLAITGQVDTALIGTSYHQEVNLQALFQDVTIYNQIIVNPDQMPELAILACQTALAKKGVSHISIPINISSQKIKGFETKKQIIKNNSIIFPHPEDLKSAASLINKSQRPCIIAGIGAREAITELVDFANLINAPIIKALRGKDILPDIHPLVLGGTGLLGTEPAYYAIKNCDLLISIGSDFPYHNFYPDANIPTIQIDNDAQQIGKKHSVTVPLIGDAKPTLFELLSLTSKKTDVSFLETCQQHMAKWFKKQDEIELSEETPIHPQTLARCISDLADENAIICCDTGTVTVWGARDFKIKGSQRFTLSGGLASMAYGLPAAIGAKLLFPEKQVIALCGDGGFAMLMSDFATAVKYKLNIKVFVFNNSKLGLIKMEQEASNGDPEFETDLNNPDYDAFAKICGGEGYTIKQVSELKTIIPKALGSSKSCIINVFVNPNELTIPPSINANEAFNFIKAKVKEAFS